MLPSTPTMWSFYSIEVQRSPLFCNWIAGFVVKLIVMLTVFFPLISSTHSFYVILALNSLDLLHKLWALSQYEAIVEKTSNKWMGHRSNKDWILGNCEEREIKNLFVLLNLALLPINIIILLVTVIREQSQMENSMRKVNKEFSG